MLFYVVLDIIKTHAHAIISSEINPDICLTTNTLAGFNEIEAGANIFQQKTLKLAISSYNYILYGFRNNLNLCPYYFWPLDQPQGWPYQQHIGWNQFY